MVNFRLPSTESGIGSLMSEDAEINETGEAKYVFFSPTESDVGA